jgi:hypothetical protein
VFVRQKQATVEETFASSLYKFDQPDRVLSYVSFIKTALYTVSNTAMVEFKSTKKSSYYSSNTVFIDCVGKIELLKVEPFVVNLNKLDTRIKISVQSFFDRVLNAVMEPAKLVNDHARDKVRREQKMIDLLEKELDLKEKELELREREIEAREDDC